jgi:ribosomal protein S18 acetylase RimI-like enzyme
MADLPPSATSGRAGSTRLSVRAAELADAEAIATVHVAAWQAAYRGGLLPDAYLDGLQVSDRTAAWERTLSSPTPPRSARLLAERDGEVVGFCVVGAERGDAAPDRGDAAPDRGDAAPDRGDEPARGEVHVLNVHPDAWGGGAGTALLAAGTEALSAAGFERAVLRVHPDNARARRFYERAGWRCDDLLRHEEVWGIEVPELRYQRELDGPTAHR